MCCITPNFYRIKMRVLTTDTLIYERIAFSRESPAPNGYDYCERKYVTWLITNKLLDSNAEDLLYLLASLFKVFIDYLN